MDSVLIGLGLVPACYMTRTPPLTPSCTLVHTIDDHMHTTVSLHRTRLNKPPMTCDSHVTPPCLIPRPFFLVVPRFEISCESAYVCVSVCVCVHVCACVCVCMCVRVCVCSWGRDYISWLQTIKLVWFGVVFQSNGIIDCTSFVSISDSIPTHAVECTNTGTGVHVHE